MPKIIFRPPYSAPPFVPPTPSYSSEVQIRINPIPWVESYDFSMIIENASLPPYDRVKLMAYRQSAQQGLELAEFIFETILFNHVYEIYAAIPYYSDYSYRFICYNQNVEVLNVPAIITYDSNIPWTPPTPEGLGNVILFEGLSEGSKVSLDYDYWKNYMVELEPSEAGNEIAYILFDMPVGNIGEMTVEINQRENENIVGYLSADAESLEISNARIQSSSEDTYDMEGYELQIS